MKASRSQAGRGAREGRIWLAPHRNGRHQLSLSYGLDELSFHTSYWYDSVDLQALEARHGATPMARVYAHMTLFEAAKLVSLRAREVDLGPYAPFRTKALETLWRRIVSGVWGQWRYENDLPDEPPPRLLGAPVASGPPPLRAPLGPVPTLSFCGGGKDSLVAMKLLERAEAPFDSLAYAHSVYGPAAPQHALIDRLLDEGRPRVRHRMWIQDDLLDAPVATLGGRDTGGTMLAAETPSSILAAIPIALAHGHRRLCLGHERSADRGNLVWAATGEEINHQWGKSFEAETLLREHIRAELVADLDFFSLLKPMHDALIIGLLHRDLDALPYAHSCNVSKPWCLRCPKCAYVWLSYMAFLPVERVDAIFGANLFDLPENQLAYRQMLGLEAHTPFECIGQVDEARLAFALCQRKGLGGRAMDAFLAEVPPVDVEPLLERYLEVAPERGALPPELAPTVLAQMREGARETLARAVATLG